jgi:uncharacterized protein YjbI with pentapeptide repeats
MKSFFCIALGFLILADPCTAQPKRAEIIAFVGECKKKKIDADMLARFGADFRGLDLKGIDLRACDVRHVTILRGADFSGANLEGAILTGCILDGANFTSAKLKGAFLGQCHLHGALFDSADLESASLDFAALDNASLKQANLSKSELSAAKFTGANLRKAILRHAHCQWYPPHFNKADLSGADLEGVVFLRGAEFRGAKLRQTNLSKAELLEADFTGADLGETDLSETTIRHAIFRDVEGVSDEAVAQLAERAARWEHDRGVLFASLLHFAYVVAYFLAPALAIGLGVYVRRRAEMLLLRKLGTFAIWMTGIGLIGPLSLFLMSFFGSHIAQYNVGNPFGYSAWSFWLGFYPILMLGLGLGCLVTAGMAVFCLVRTCFAIRVWWRLALCWSSALMHFCLQFPFMSKFFPDA